MEARGAGPTRPHGAGARCCCGCQGPVQVGRGEASFPRLEGERTEGEGSGNRAPAGALCTPATAQLLPEGPVRPRALARWRRILGAQAQLAQLESPEEGGPQLRQRCSAARNSPSGFARTGVGRGGFQFGCLAAQAVVPAGLKGSGRRASLLVLVSFFYPKVSQISRINQGMSLALVIVRYS